jgi:hypothetical protein
MPLTLSRVPKGCIYGSRCLSPLRGRGTDQRKDRCLGTVPKLRERQNTEVGPGLMGFISLCMGSACCVDLWIPVIGWVMAPLFFLAALVLWILALVRLDVFPSSVKTASSGSP